MNISGNKVVNIIAYVLCLLLWVEESEAQDDVKQIQESRHRLDFALIFLDSIIDDSLNAELGYSYSLTPKTNISAAISYLDSNVRMEGGSGLGDTSFTFSWTPLVPVSVGPWVPRRIGTGIGVILPTGDAADGRGLDATIITPFVGLVFPVTETISIFPSVTYLRSTDRTVTGNELEIGVVDLGIGWVSSKGLWLRLYAAWVRDFEADNSHFNYAVSAGTTFSHRWSASIDYNETDFFVPGLTLNSSNQVEKQISLNLHYNF